MATRLMVYDMRGSYLQNIWTPKPFEEGDTPAWTAQGLLDPNNPKHAKQIAEIEAIEKAELRKAWAASKDGNKGEAFFEKVWADIGQDRALRDGGLKGGDYEGMRYLAARATQGKQAAPIVLDRRATRVAEGAEGAPYSGCFINLQVEIWAQWGKYKRVNCTFLGIQFVRDGDAFGGGKPADLSAFADLGDQGDDGEDLSNLA